jgi:circadian clock protein KaiC
MSQDTSLTQLERFSSGITGLDRVLNGGFFVGGVYLVEGMPGAGKTIHANQICFHHVQSERRALYVTLLAESHARLLQHLQGMSFFDAGVIPERLTYVSGFRTLESEGLKGLMDLIRKELRAQRASLVVLDGFAVVGESAESDREFKKLVHELQVHAGLARCTFFLLSSGIAQAVHPVHTMVDGLVRLTDRVIGRRADRELYVQKLRGSGYLRGAHTFSVSDSGIRVHPRIESLEAGGDHFASDARLTFNIPNLDAMLGGGILADTTTMILGPSGVGKTSLGYKFIEASTEASAGMVFSFYESLERAKLKARGLKIDLETPLAAGHLHFLWQRPVEISLDAIAERLLEAVERHKPKRLLIDGFNALLVSAASPDRVPQFFSALGEMLRERGVTTLYTAELHDIFSPRIAPPAEGISPLLESLILMRFVEMGASLYRLISVLKMRASDFDPALRELTLTDVGLSVADTFRSAEAILTGVAIDEPPTRRRAPSKKRKSAARKRRRE